ncbi:spermatogenesis-associated protein 4 [Physocladia obscura]|uniref:Spermatogenesis-associated protein 4 n=1 Tax=Physocladia obscura TaxID=109957 RepID=A0AAD5T0B0_9FUNG|nr:spermatogenesis-associated protein 4 [Physocladia obscura]
MTSLTRDVLKWVQSLDLTYSIKNTKRDLANGFLLAEMLSKYHPLEFQMHGYDTGMGPVAKRNNWEQLVKACSKVGIIFSKELVDDVMRSKAEAGAVALGIVHHHVIKSGSGPLGIIQTAGTTLPPQQNPSKVKQAHNTKPKTSKKDSLYQYEPVEMVDLQGNLIKKQSKASPNGDIVINNSKAASQFLSGIEKVDKEQHDEKCLLSAPDIPSSDENLGKIAVLKILCSMFGISDSQITFGRFLFMPSVCREKLTNKFDVISSDDIERLPSLLATKENELLSILQYSPPGDIALLFEVLLPCIISFAADTKVLHVATTLTVYFGKILQDVSPTNDAFNRLSQIKEFSALMSCIVTFDEKIPFVARILNAFINEKTSDGEKVRIFLAIKNMLQTSIYKHISTNGACSSGVVATVTSSSNVADATGMIFIRLLCAMQLESGTNNFVRRKMNIDTRESSHNKTEGQKLCNTTDSLEIKSDNTNSSQQQHITLILSECLTVLNTHRKAAELGSLFLHPSLVLDVCAALHLLSSLATKLESISDTNFENFGRLESSAIGFLPDGVAGDVIGRERGYLRAVTLTNCPSNLQKAYTSFVTSVLENIDDSHTLAPLARNAAGCLLNTVYDDSLRTCLILMAPCLKAHIPLCSLFVQGIAKTTDAIRTILLSISNNEDSNWNINSSTTLLSEATVKYICKRDQEGLVIYWDIPFLDNRVFPRVVDSWYPFGVGIGTVRTMEILKYSIMPREYLQILLAIGVQIALPPEQINQKNHQDSWLDLFNLVSPWIFASLTNDETSELGVNILEAFWRLEPQQCGGKNFNSIGKNLGKIVASVIHLHVVGQRRSRERLMRFLGRWSLSFDSGGVAIDNVSIALEKFLKDENENAVHLGKVNMQNRKILKDIFGDVLEIFRNKFPALSAGLEIN